MTRVRPATNDNRHHQESKMTAVARKRRGMSGAGALLRGVIAGAAAAACLALTASAAEADSSPRNPDKFGLAVFETGVDGTHDAGGHPNVWTRIRFNTTDVETDMNGREITHGTPREIAVDLPIGLVGNPQALPTCTMAQFFATMCPVKSQIGHLAVSPYGSNFTDEMLDMFFGQIYNLGGDGQHPAVFGMNVVPTLGIFAVLRTEVRADGGLRVTTDALPRTNPLVENKLTFWGVPADNNPANPTPGVDSPEWPRQPFMSSPTDCTQFPTTRVKVTSYEGRTDTASHTQPDKPVNCDSMTFEPHITAQPTRREAGAPTGLRVDIIVPQTTGADERVTPHLRDVTVKLPDGLTINAGTARDLSACSDAEYGLGRETPARCPRGSKIGKVGIATPLLPNPIPGDIYMGEPKPGELFRLFIYVEGQGVRLKIPGTLQLDPATGQVTAVFRDNPQMPFTRFSLEFRGGNNAALALPTTCGTKKTVAGMTSWAGQAAPLEHAFQVYGNDAGDACADPQPFKPSFVAGTTTADAGGDTGLSLTFGRGDQDEYLGKLEMDLPHGLLGRLADFPRCPLATAMANQCSDESLVGGVKVAAGAGNALLHLPGKVYLTEAPKAGQIAGLAIVVRALAGPYDLGTVVVKTGITVNPDTSLSVESDPLPTMLEGVPLRIRQVTVDVDRPGFMFNPTDCSPKRIEATISSAGGTQVGLGSPFQVRGCSKLEFSPPMTIEATAPHPLTRVMGLEVNLGGIGGQTNPRQVQVVLPPQIGARLDGPVQTQCTEAQFAIDACPAESRVGTSRADTPILSTPLIGDVFFLENVTGGNLPRMAVRLKGEVLLDLIADVEITAGGRYTTTFGAVPDVPISNFRLKLEEGSQAILTSAPICGRKLSAERNMIAHNGKFTNDRIPVTVAGCPGTKTKSKKASQKKSAREGKVGNKRRGA